MDRRQFIAGVVTLFASRKVIAGPPSLVWPSYAVEPNLSTLRPGELALYLADGREVCGAGYRRITRWDSVGKDGAAVDYGEAFSDWGCVCWVGLFLFPPSGILADDSKPLHFPLSHQATVLRGDRFRLTFALW